MRAPEHPPPKTRPARENADSIRRSGRDVLDDGLAIRLCLPDLSDPLDAPGRPAVRQHLAGDRPDARGVLRRPVDGWRGIGANAARGRPVPCGPTRWLELGIAARGDRGPHRARRCPRRSIPCSIRRMAEASRSRRSRSSSTLLMVFPASFLMGGTLPMLGQAVIRSADNRSAPPRRGCMR